MCVRAWGGERSVCACVGRGVKCVCVRVILILILHDPGHTLETDYGRQRESEREMIALRAMHFCTGSCQATV